MCFFLENSFDSLHPLTLVVFYFYISCQKRDSTMANGGQYSYRMCVRNYEITLHLTILTEGKSLSLVTKCINNFLCKAGNYCSTMDPLFFSCHCVEKQLNYLIRLTTFPLYSDT